MDLSTKRDLEDKSALISSIFHPIKCISCKQQFSATSARDTNSNDYPSPFMLNAVVIGECCWCLFYFLFTFWLKDLCQTHSLYIDMFTTN